MTEVKGLISGSVEGVSRKKLVMVSIDADILYAAKQKHRGFISWAAEKGIKAALVHYSKIEESFFPEVSGKQPKSKENIFKKLLR